MTTFYYDRVTARRTQTGRCPVCAGLTVRVRTFGQTVNPSNKNEDGSVKTGHEVWLAVNEEADAWTPDFTHEKCLQNGGE